MSNFTLYSLYNLMNIHCHYYEKNIFRMYETFSINL